MSFPDHVRGRVGAATRPSVRSRSPKPNAEPAARRGGGAGITPLGRAFVITFVVLLALPAGGPSRADIDDPLKVHQWALSQIHLDEAWERSVGEGAVIAVVDTGIDLRHPDLFVAGRDSSENAKILPGNTFANCGASGCGDGHWVRHDLNERGHSHGTLVAGIATATAGNGIGIAGVAPAARLLPVRVSGNAGTLTWRDVAFGIRWAADKGADVINLSLGMNAAVEKALGVLQGDEGLADAVQYALEQDVVLVASAGNTALPLCHSPAFYDGIVCVAATDRDERPAEYSNLPWSPDMVAVAAPGGMFGDCGDAILSTTPSGFGSAACGYPSELEYGEQIGTSMAAPHVAGVAALVTALGCDRLQTVHILTSTARTPGTPLRGQWGPVYGYGVVDGAAATAAAAACNNASGQ